jgi:hypothetical protein
MSMMLFILGELKETRELALAQPFRLPMGWSGPVSKPAVVIEFAFTLLSQRRSKPLSNLQFMIAA